MQTAVDTEVELDRVIEWRIAWLRSGGFSPKNAKMIARRTTIDWRYANRVLNDCKAKGHSEDFVVKLIL